MYSQSPSDDCSTFLRCERAQEQFRKLCVLFLPFHRFASSNLSSRWGSQTSTRKRERLISSYGVAHSRREALLTISVEQKTKLKLGKGKEILQNATNTAIASKCEQSRSNPLDIHPSTKKCSHRSSGPISRPSQGCTHLEA